jgi:hypothetical protein
MDEDGALREDVEVDIVSSRKCSLHDGGTSRENGEAGVKSVEICAMNEGGAWRGDGEADIISLLALCGSRTRCSWVRMAPKNEVQYFESKYNNMRSFVSKRGSRK